MIHVQVAYYVFWKSLIKSSHKSRGNNNWKAKILTPFLLALPRFALPCLALWHSKASFWGLSFWILFHIGCRALFGCSCKILIYISESTHKIQIHCMLCAALDIKCGTAISDLNSRGMYFLLSWHEHYIETQTETYNKELVLASK